MTSKKLQFYFFLNVAISHVAILCTETSTLANSTDSKPTVPSKTTTTTVEARPYLSTKACEKYTDCPFNISCNYKFSLCDCSGIQNMTNRDCSEALRENCLKDHFGVFCEYRCPTTCAYNKKREESCDRIEVRCWWRDQASFGFTILTNEFITARLFYNQLKAQKPNLETKIAQAKQTDSLFCWASEKWIRISIYM